MKAAEDPDTRSKRSPRDNEHGMKGSIRERATFYSEIEIATVHFKLWLNYPILFNFRLKDI